MLNRESGRMSEDVKSRFGGVLSRLATHAWISKHEIAFLSEEEKDTFQRHMRYFVFEKINMKDQVVHKRGF